MTRENLGELVLDEPRCRMWRKLLVGVGEDV